jgi:signal peptidase I
VTSYDERPGESRAGGAVPPLTGAPRHAADPRREELGPPPTDEPPVGAAEPEERHGSFWRELPFLILIALALALLIKAFLVQAFYIPSGSMEDTLHIGDRVLVNKLVYRTRDIHRGEIVVFKGPESWTPEVSIAPATNPVQRVLRSIGSAIGVAPPGEKDFIKRVIGVGGDTVQCCDPKGRVVVNGVPLDEPYILQDNHESFGPVHVPKGRLWVMGDHRGASYDSRGHRGAADDGTIPVKNVVGRAFVKVWPASHWGTLPVPETFKQKGLTATAAGALVAGGPLALGFAGAFPLTIGQRRARRRIGAALRARATGRGRHRRP